MSKAKSDALCAHRVYVCAAKEFVAKFIAAGVRPVLWVFVHGRRRLSDVLDFSFSTMIQR
jgi:hypothetical protein